MKFFLLYILFAWVCGGYALAQNVALDTRQSYAEASLNGGEVLALSLAWNKLYSITRNRRFSIGYGVRFTATTGNDVDFVTAPAHLTSGQTGPQVLFVDNIAANFDTLTLRKAQVNALNLAICLQYTFSPKWSVGFNIDAIGFSFGSQQNGTFRSSDFVGGNLTQQTARPTPLNLLLISDNDIGSLNSELFVRYKLSSRWGIRAGFSFLFNEYTTLQKLSRDNDRFRLKSFLGMLGVSWQLR